MSYHVVLSVIVVILSLAAYIPYIKDTVRGKTKPHAFTWLVATITAGIAFALQLYGGGGIGAWPMFIITIICIVVLILSVFKGTKDVRFIDLVCLAIALYATYVWVVVNDPFTSVVSITIAEIFGFISTMRKAWNAPHSETLALYEISAVRHSLAVLALEHISLITALYPAAWALMNVLVAIELRVRRKLLK